MSIRRVITLAVLICGCVLAAVETSAQRRITPVDPPKSAQPAISKPKNAEPEKVLPPPNLAERKDAEGNIVLVDTVSGKEWVDSTEVKVQTKMIYPLMESVAVGVDFADMVLRLFNQEYGGIGFWAELSLHNRYKPIIEAGLSMAKIQPDGTNYTFRSPMRPYFKIGCNYNIFYNNSPNYQATVGVRYGFSSFSYSYDDVTTGGGYWGDPVTFNIPSQSCTAGYFELVAAVKVMIYRNFALGWNVKYHSILHESANEYGKPLYIPGYGKRGNSFAFGFSAIYTFTLNKPDPEAVNNKKK